MRLTGWLSGSIKRCTPVLLYILETTKRIIKMEEKELNSVTSQEGDTTETEFDPVQAINELKQNSVSKEEYNKVVEEIHFELICKKCPRCDKKFYPNAYLKHSSKCNRKRSMTDGEVTKVFEGEQCKVTKRRRKMSMENLKSIAKDEIKGFKSFNLLRYLNK